MIIGSDLTRYESAWMTRASLWSFNAGRRPCRTPYFDPRRRVLPRVKKTRHQWRHCLGG